MNAEEQYRTAVITLEAAQRTLGATPRDDVEARAAATKVVEAAHTRVRETKEALKTETARRNFAGIGSPLHEALVARIDPSLVAELEADALRRQGEREDRAAARRAAKASAAPPPPPTMAPPAASPAARQRHVPEVVVLPRRAIGGRP